MGRPLKTGLDFFSTDIDMDEDDKLLDLLDAVGTIEGTGIVWQLLNAIYKNGYFLELNDSILKKLCRKKHLDKDKMNIGIEYLTGMNMSYSQRAENASFFDYEVYKNYKVLTSRGVQKRYLLASARRLQIVFDRRFILLDCYEDIKLFKKKYDSELVDTKGQWVDLDLKSYLITFKINGLLGDNVNINPVNDNINNNYVDNMDINPVNVDTSAQKKRKEIDRTGNRKEIDRTGQEIEIPFSGFKQSKQRSYTEEYKILLLLWNSLDLPECRKLSPNLPNWGEIMESMKLYTLEEIEKSISNYHNLRSRKTAISYSTFPNFLIRGIEKYADSSIPFDNFKETQDEKKNTINTIPNYIPEEPLTNEEIEKRERLIEDTGGISEMFKKEIKK